MFRHTQSIRALTHLINEAIPSSVGRRFQLLTTLTANDGACEYSFLGEGKGIPTQVLRHAECGELVGIDWNHLAHSSAEEQTA